MVRSVKTYWFYLLLPVCLMVGWALSIQPETLADPIAAERVFLFDFCLFLPVLYFLYLRRDIGAKAAAIRAFALLGAGIWFVGFLLPVGGEILPTLGLLRWIAVPILVFFLSGRIIYHQKVKYILLNQQSLLLKYLKKTLE